MRIHGSSASCLCRAKGNADSLTHTHRRRTAPQVFPRSSHSWLAAGNICYGHNCSGLWKGFFGYGTKDAWYNTTIKKITTARVPFADGDPRASASTSAKAGEKRSPKAFWIHRVDNRTVFHCVQLFRTFPTHTTLLPSAKCSLNPCLCRQGVWN